MQKFSEKVSAGVQKIKKGEFKTYQEIARISGSEKSARAVGNVLARNKNAGVPCHRVVKNNRAIGGYLGSEKNAWKKLALLLKEGAVAVMPTDTIYGICGAALDKKAVEKIYKLRKRSPGKPMIVLVSSLNDLNVFGIKPDKKEKSFLKKVWPGKVSVILGIRDKANIKRFEYLHRGTKTLSFRLPKNKFLNNVLAVSGPLAAPSANWENYAPAETIGKAKKYFGDEVVYYDGGKIAGHPSALIKLKKGKIEVLRSGLTRNKSIRACFRGEKKL